MDFLEFGLNPIEFRMNRLEFLMNLFLELGEPPIKLLLPLHISISFAEMFPRVIVAVNDERDIRTKPVGAVSNRAYGGEVIPRRA